MDAPVAVHHLGDAEVDSDGHKRNCLVLGQSLGAHQEAAHLTECISEGEIDRGFFVDLLLRLGAQLLKIISEAEAVQDPYKKALQIAARAFHEARKEAAEARRAYSRLKGNLAVWKKDEDAAKAVTDEDRQATEKERVASLQFQEPKPGEAPSGGKISDSQEKKAAPPEKREEDLRRQLVGVKPTLNAPLWRMLPHEIWYVYRGKLGDNRQCWLKGDATPAWAWCGPFRANINRTISSQRLIDNGRTSGRSQGAE